MKQGARVCTQALCGIGALVMYVGGQSIRNREREIEQGKRSLGHGRFSEDENEDKFEAESMNASRSIRKHEASPIQ